MEKITRVPLILLTALLSWLATAVSGQPLCRITYYDEEDGLPHGHVTQLLQDKQGFLWFATWNGLCRFDGYEFQNFKMQAGDGCHMPTDRIRNIALRPDGHITCRVDDGYFLFDTHTYHFRDLTEQETSQAADALLSYRTSKSMKSSGRVEWTDTYGTSWTLTQDGQLSYKEKGQPAVNYPLEKKLQEITFTLTDRQGNLWALGSDGIYKFCTDIQRTQRLPIERSSEVKCLFMDSRRRYWVTTREDAAVRVYTLDGDRLLGYLGGDGRLHPNYTCFPAPVYCIYEGHDGTLWLGTKPDGIYRLRGLSAGQFRIDHLTQLPNPNIYNILADGNGRLWVATLGGGLCYTTRPQDNNPRFTTPKNYPHDVAQRVRYLHITKEGVLTAATTDGLVTSQLERNAEDMLFHRFVRDPDRATSLSCNATMDVLETSDGSILVSTESGGINTVRSSQLTDSTANFERRQDIDFRLPHDVALSLTAMDKGRLMVVSNHQVTVIDSTGSCRVLDAGYFRTAQPSRQTESTDARFSDAHPLALQDGRWLFGLKDGAVFTFVGQMYQPAYRPRLVLTGISVQGGTNYWGADALDSLSLQPDERSLTVRFAAIDHHASKNLHYEFRLLTEAHPDSTQWNFIDDNRSVTLLDLRPGTYRLEIQSTDADGQWTGNVRRLTLIVTPTFWESTIGRLLIVVLLLTVIGTIAYTLLYIRRIKRKQRETLEAYLKLLESPLPQPDKPTPAPAESVSDPMLERVMAYIEENIANNDANVGDMATAAATSRSGLQRKLKQAMGITPQDLLREARIKHACQLLRTTDKSVAEVAYACGFADPKYFSRSFKQSIGQTPSEYKNASSGSTDASEGA